MTSEDPLWGTFATFSILNIISSAIKRQKTRRLLRCWYSQPADAPFCTCCRCPLLLCDKRNDAWKLPGLTNESKQTGKHQHSDASALPGTILPIFRWSRAHCWSKTAKIFFLKNDEKMRRGERKRQKNFNLLKWENERGTYEANQAIRKTMTGRVMHWSHKKSSLSIVSKIPKWHERFCQFPDWFRYNS